MKRKILALLLTFVLVLTAFTGCGKKDSTYFKELKEISKVTTGTSTSVIDLTFKGDDLSDIPELLMDTNGNVALSLKLDSISESDMKGAFKIYAKLGTETEYSEITTLAIDDKILYLTVDPIINFVKKIDEAMATELETTLSSMGIVGSISLDLEKVLQALEQEYPTISDDMKMSTYEMIDSLFDSLDKNFAELTSQDGKDYTFTLNGENAEVAVNGIVNFLKNDASGVLEKIKALMIDIYGEDNEITSELISSYDEMINELPDTATSVEESKEDIITTIKDYNINVTSTAQINGKSGKREGKLSIDTGNIVVEDMEFAMKLSSELKEGEASVAELIPEDASDITTLLVTSLTQFAAYDTEGMYVEE